MCAANMGRWGPCASCETVVVASEALRWHTGRIHIQGCRCLRVLVRWTASAIREQHRHSDWVCLRLGRPCGYLRIYHRGRTLLVQGRLFMQLVPHLLGTHTAYRMPR